MTQLIIATMQTGYNGWSCTIDDNDTIISAEIEDHLPGITHVLYNEDGYIIDDPETLEEEVKQYIAKIMEGQGDYKLNIVYDTCSS